ncbi:hypothetical protein [Burkholderia plantarii]|uniref:hypothetical protein n=1 Tax=Burkholderia plantarii TaxID=41899 RepID=UPI0006D8A885|nr:hypothetical protein [Burkholderia plantarii]GLZ20712.1 hypothetical protein Bpla01_42410 [Burkholderia plantarii]
MANPFVEAGHEGPGATDELDTMPPHVPLAHAETFAHIGSMADAGTSRGHVDPAATGCERHALN